MPTPCTGHGAVWVRGRQRQGPRTVRRAPVVTTAPPPTGASGRLAGRTGQLRPCARRERRHGPSTCRTNYCLGCKQQPAVQAGGSDAAGCSSCAPSCMHACPWWTNELSAAADLEARCSTPSGQVARHHRLNTPKLPGPANLACRTCVCSTMAERCVTRRRDAPKAPGVITHRIASSAAQRITYYY